jgi:hypothetical protein
MMRREEGVTSSKFLLVLKKMMEEEDVILRTSMIESGSLDFQVSSPSDIDSDSNQEEEIQ